MNCDSFTSLPVELLLYIRSYLNSSNSNRLRRVSKYYYGVIPVIINDFMHIPDHMFEKITDAVIRENPQMVMLDISECADDLDLFNPLGCHGIGSNLIYLKGSFKIADNIDEDGLYIRRMQKLRVIENIIPERLGESDDDSDNNFRSDTETYKMLKRVYNNLLIIMYNNSDFDDLGMYAELLDSKPYVMLFDMEDCKSACDFNKDNLQILQITLNVRPITLNSELNLHVLMVRIASEVLIEPEDLNYHVYNMSNLRCCVIIDDFLSIVDDIENGECDNISEYMIRVINMFSAYSTNIEELYMIIGSSGGYEVHDGDIHDFSELHNNEDLQQAINSQINIKYIQVTHRKIGMVYQYHKPEYTPSAALTKIRSAEYALTLEDIYSLYRHFDIPMCKEMEEMFDELDIN